jgi:hypothetical protein
MEFAWATGATTTLYLVVPYKCTIRYAWGTCDGDPGDDETVIFQDGSSNTVATLTWGSGIAAGAVAAFSRDATYGDHEFAAGAVIPVVVSQGSAAVGGRLLVELDAHCLKHLDRDA